MLTLTTGFAKASQGLHKDDNIQNIRFDSPVTLRK